MSDVPFTLPNFEMRKLLGKGGMASVWLAHQISLDRDVAVKVLSPEFSTSEEDVRQFLAEAQVAARLKHQNIVEVYDANCSSNGYYYFVMELVRGYTMGDLLQRKARLSLDDVLAIGESVAVALDYAWTNFKMVHCDIKPDNIMVDADGTVKVTDLGLCRSLTLNRGQESAGDEIYGTPAYMSPEQIYSDVALDCRSDIYELGATLYHFVTGRMLFQGMTDEMVLRSHVGEAQAPDPRLIRPEIPQNVVFLLEKMLAKDRGHRQQNWRAVINDLQRIRAGKAPWPVIIPPKGSSIARNA